MRRLISAELLAAISPRTAWFLALVPAVLSAASVWGNLYGVEKAGSTGPGSVELLQAMGPAAQFALILGVVGATSGYRHGTITARSVYVPVRWRALTARVAAYAVLGLAYAALCAAIVAVNLIIVAATHPATGFGAALYGMVLAGSLWAGAMYAAIGAAFGDIVRNQVAGVAIALLWVVVVEAPLQAVARGAAQFLPGGLQAVLLHAPGAGGLTPVTAGALLAGWALALTGLAAGFGRRDIR